MNIFTAMIAKTMGYGEWWKVQFEHFVINDIGH